jgi:hypothetical protein
MTFGSGSPELDLIFYIKKAPRFAGAFLATESWNHLKKNRLHLAWAYYRYSYNLLWLFYPLDNQP